MKHTLNRFTYIFIDALIIIISFMLVAWIKPATVRLVLPQYQIPFMVYALIWISFSSIGEKYRVIEEKSFVRIATKILVINFVIISFIFALLIIFKFSFSRIIVLGTISFSTIGELFLFFIVYYTQKFFIENPSFAKSPMVMDFQVPIKTQKSDAEKIQLSFDSLNRYNPKFNIIENVEDSIMIPLLTNYLEKDDTLFEYISKSIVLEHIQYNNSIVIDNSSQYTIEHLENESQEFILNLHPINDFRRINKFLITINKSMKMGAVFIGNGETLQQRKQRFLSDKYPKFIKQIFTFFDFAFNRAFPKMTLFKGVYFALTKGRNRPLSKCEILGRLYSCGFEAISVEELNRKLFFIMRKTKEPIIDNNPSYAPIFKMKRRGKDGKYIHVYKFRTMHPYAEYLQHYMIENFGYGDKGKVEDDFRITSWGKWMRRLWLDESPQILNWLKGDLAIVGVRPLSDRFLAEYPDDLKEERFKYKPGCIPPYVALKMQAVEKYLESERIYLAEKKKRPIWTDIKYFWWAVYNILTNKIRSE